MTNIRYAGFWVRFMASLLDTIFLALPIGIVIYFLSDGTWFDFAQYQENMRAAMSLNPEAALSNAPQTSLKWEILFEFSVLLVSVLFWRQFKGATPGKKMMGIKVVDAKSFEIIDNKQAITRSLGYFVSTFTLLIGFLMVGWRKDKRSLHDLLASSAVIYEEENNVEE